jgi:hypothetical protein
LGKVRGKIWSSLTVNMYGVPFIGLRLIHSPPPDHQDL